jgi:hypothetical protein
MGDGRRHCRHLTLPNLLTSISQPAAQLSHTDTCNVKSSRSRHQECEWRENKPRVTSVGNTENSATSPPSFHQSTHQIICLMRSLRDHELFPCRRPFSKPYGPSLFPARLLCTASPKRRSWQSSICNDLNSSREAVPVRTGTYPWSDTVSARGLMIPGTIALSPQLQIQVPRPRCSAIPPEVIIATPCCILTGWVSSS